MTDSMAETTAEERAGYLAGVLSTGTREFRKKTILDAIREAAERERERIADHLEEQGGLHPCTEDGKVYRSAAWLVRADFSFDEAERLELAAEKATET